MKTTSDRLAETRECFSFLLVHNVPNLAVATPRSGGRVLLTNPTEEKLHRELPRAAEVGEVGPPPSTR